MFKQSEVIKITDAYELATQLKNQVKDEQTYEINSKRLTIKKRSKTITYYINTRTNEAFLDLPKDLPAEDFDKYIKVDSNTPTYKASLDYDTRLKIMSILSKVMYEFTDYHVFRNHSILAFKDDCIPMKDELIKKYKIKYNNYIKRQEQEKLLNQFVYPNLDIALRKIGLTLDKTKGNVYMHHFNSDWIGQQLNKIIEEKLKEIGNSLGVDIKYRSNLKNFRIARNLAHLRINLNKQ